MEYYGKCGKNLTWTFDSYTGTLTIAGSGEMYDFNIFRCPWRSCRSNIRQIAFPAGLTSIGDYAFYGCTGPTQLTFPDGLTEIGNFAFYGCTGLTDVVIPASVTEIGKGAFRDCPCERVVLRKDFDENAEAKRIEDCERLLSDGIILNNLSVLRNPSYLFEKCKKLYGKEAIDIVFAASVLLHRDTEDVSIRPSEKLIEWAEKVPMLGGIRSDVQYLRFSLVAPWGADAVKVYPVIRRYLNYEFRKDC